MKIYDHDAGLMTKMPAMPIYGNNTIKSSFPEPVGQFRRNIVCSIGDSSPSKFVHMMTWVKFRVILNLFYGKVKLCNLGFHMGHCDHDEFNGKFCNL